MTLIKRLFLILLSTNCVPVIAQSAFTQSAESDHPLFVQPALAPSKIVTATPSPSTLSPSTGPTDIFIPAFIDVSLANTSPYHPMIVQMPQTQISQDYMALRNTTEVTASMVDVTLASSPVTSTIAPNTIAPNTIAPTTTLPFETGLTAKISTYRTANELINIVFSLQNSQPKIVSMGLTRNNTQDCTFGPFMRVLKVGTREVVYPVGNEKICAQDFNTAQVPAQGSLNYTRQFKLISGDYMLESWINSIIDNQVIKISAPAIRLSFK